MKKLALSLLAALSLMLGPGLLLVSQAAAVSVFQPCSSTTDGSAVAGSSVCTDAQNQSTATTDPVINILKVVIQILAIVIGVTSIIIIIVSGLRMITAAGDSQGIASARSGIIYALVGLVVALFAQAFIAFVLNRIQ